MALYYDLPVFRDVYKLILKIFDYTKDLPKEYKNDLSKKNMKLISYLDDKGHVFWKVCFRDVFLANSYEKTNRISSILSIQYYRSISSFISNITIVEIC